MTAERTDRERLDWIEKHARQDGVEIHRNNVPRSPVPVRVTGGRTLREAIDAAMAEGGEHG